MTPESAQEQRDRVMEEKERSIPSKESVEALMAESKDSHCQKHSYRQET